MSEYIGHELDWDDEIEKDGDSFEVLPEGDYNFRVIKFERGRHNGSAKIPACKKAILTLDVFNAENKGQVMVNLFLYSSFEKRLGQFFVSIGEKQTGERIRMNWNKVQNGTGVCYIKTRKWTGDDGKERESNEVSKFYEPDNAPDVPITPPWSQVQGNTPWDTGGFD